VTSALDAGHRALPVAAIDALRHDHGTIMLLITHDPALAAQVADRVVVVEDGMLATDPAHFRRLPSSCTQPGVVRTQTCRLPACRSRSTPPAASSDVMDTGSGRADRRGARRVLRGDSTSFATFPHADVVGDRTGREYAVNH
jgi:ABC-type glutathione transport system ATPase component